MMAEKYIYLKMTKEWGGFQIGQIVRFGENKARGRIAAGEGIEVSKPSPAKKPLAETATANPVAETAEVTPQKKQKTSKTRKRN